MSKIYFRAENGSEDHQTEDFGPFEYVQLTYKGLEIGDGQFVAGFDDGFWRFNPSARRVLNTRSHIMNLRFTDIVIFSK